MPVSVIAAGGQVYDRTTGTWAGETQGSVGDGIDRSVMQGQVTIWHDAEDISGVTSPGRGLDGRVLGTTRGGTPVVATGTVVRRSPTPAPTPRGAATPVVVTPGGAGTAGPGVPAVAVPQWTPDPTQAAPLEVKTKTTATGLVLGMTGWLSNPKWSDADQWEQRYGEPGDWLGGIVTMGADLGYNAKKYVDYIASQAPTWAGALPSDIQEPDPIYHDGWVSYDERQTWERAPAGSPAADYWSF